MPKSILSLVLIGATCVSAYAVTLTDTTVASLTNGTGLAIAPDGRVFVLQQTGQIRIVENGILQATPALDISAFDAAFSLGFASEHGLLGIALDPNFATNQNLYVQYTSSLPGGIGNRIARFTMNTGANTIDQTSAQTLLDTEANGNNGHAGGGLAFGADGKLYTTIGDRRVPSSAQDPNDTWGSILRLNPNGTFAGGTVIPGDNPLCTDQTQKQCAIYVQGLRNPFGIAVQPGTGLMFINDAGEQTWEEINAVAASGVTPPPSGASGVPGSNFGWDQCEGPCAPADPGKVDPLYYYSSAGGSGSCAITAGTFYNPASPNLPGNFAGDYLFVDFCNGKLTALDFNGATPTTEVLHQLPGFGTVALGVDSVGGIYYLSRRDGESADNRLGYLFDTSVPEPSTWVTAALALAVICVRRGKGLVS